ncbi:hypothetical protein [Clostridium sp. DL1XJH146]
MKKLEEKNEKNMKKVQRIGRFLYFKILIPALYTALGTVVGMLALQLFIG